VTAKKVDLDTQLQAETKAHRDRDTELQALKEKVGHNLAEIGEADAAGTVLGEMQNDVTKFAPGDLAQATYRETLQRMSEAMAQLTQERNALNAEKDKLQATINALQEQYQASVSANEQAREGAEKDRDAAQRTKEETISAKDQQIASLEERNRSLALELAQEKDSASKIQADLRQSIAKLEEINNKLREKQEAEEDLSFDSPDGLVDWVDHNNRLVWINLGEADSLKKRTSFSVYTKGHFGVARRDKRDIKGSIEVTRILGPHQAEARITSDTLTDPIAPGDPIYTPLWGSGRHERFGSVGLIDLDNDGRSDRERFHEILAAAGASLDTEIDDNGVRIPADSRLDVHTKFLIVGEIPDPTKSKPNEVKAHEEIARRHKELMQEARIQGIKVVNLNDFLDYIGYQPKRRLWQPGTEAGWNLKKGARSTGVTPSITGPSESSGRTSGAYSGNRRLAPPESSGTTSGAYSGSR